MIKTLSILSLMVVQFAIYGQQKGDAKIHLYGFMFYSEYADTTSSARVYHSQNTFTDHLIFCHVNNKKCEIDFKTDNRNWYIKSGGHWRLFYDDKKKQLNNVVLKSQKLRAQPDTVIRVNNDTLYSFLCVSTEWENSEYSMQYYFHPDYGIVLIKGTNVRRRMDYHNAVGLKREFFYPLPKEEEERPEDNN